MSAAKQFNSHLVGHHTLCLSYRSLVLMVSLIDRCLILGYMIFDFRNMKSVYCFYKRQVKRADRSRDRQLFFFFDDPKVGNPHGAPSSGEDKRDCQT